MKQTQEKPRLNVVEQSAQTQLRILLVDRDEPETAEVRRAFDRNPEIHLEFTADTETASHMIAATRHDLVVIDAELPGSFALLKEIKNKYRWVGTLVVSRNHTPSFLRQVVKSRIDGLLFKPVTPAELLEQAILLATAVSVRRHSQQMRVLAIGAHPDDVEIGCGGTLAKHHANHDLLHILTLSRGSAGGDVNIRAIEAQSAATLLGAHLKIANLSDTYIGEGAETISAIEAAVRELNPTHVYTHCLEDTHQDHRAVHTASLVACRNVPNVYCYQTPSSTVEFKPHRFVDITEFIKQKVELISVYKSQVDRMPSIQSDLRLATARYWGRFAGYVLAEPLRIIRQRDSDMVPDFGKEYSQLQAGALAESG